jgi:sugar/nucleoside kinase (ribokinase family)
VAKKLKSEAILKKAISTILQPLIDVLVNVEPSFLKDRNLQPGSYAPVDRPTQDVLFAATTEPPTRASGGSASNSIACANILGVACTYAGLVGDDENGHLYQKDFADLGITSPNRPVPNKRTGVCLSLVTPDGERTMRTDLAVALELEASHIERETIAASDWLLLEGHLLTAGDKNVSALMKGIEIANQCGTKVALNINSEFAARTKRDTVLADFLPKISMLIGNESEAMALAAESSVHMAFASLSKLCSSVVVTCGRDGALISYDGKILNTPAHTHGIAVVDTTGAGDAFTGTLLGGLSLSCSIEKAAIGAARLAAATVAQPGARLPASALSLWRDAIK